MEIPELRDILRGSLMDFLWDQWVALGVAGHASGRPIPFVIDPEALSIATLRFSMDESRFRTEVLDWFARNGGLISVQRMKNLDAAMGIAPPAGVGGLSRFMEKAGRRNWKTLRTSGAGSIDFNAITLRGMSRPPDTEQSQNFLLRMRLLLGVSARAEVYTWLLTHEGGHAARIARETAWFSKSVQAILNDLEQAAILVSRIEGKRKKYALRQGGIFGSPGLETPLCWFAQAPFYTGTHHLLKILEDAAEPDLSEHARAIAIRRHLPPVEDAFHRAGLGKLYSGANHERGEAFIRTFQRGTRSLIQYLETRALPGISGAAA